mgnify:CR=1 FL=1
MAGGTNLLLSRCQLKVKFKTNKTRTITLVNLFQDETVLSSSLLVRPQLHKTPLAAGKVNSGIQ